MTDGNTAIQVSPTEDAEMAGIKQVFDKALNAIVDMSRLAKEVETLRQSVSAMQGQVDHLRRQNEWLDEMLAKVRTERDGLSHQVAEQAQTVTRLQRENETLNASNIALQTDRDEMRTAKHDAEQARDEAQLKIMELEDQIKGHVAKLDKFQSIAKELFPEPAPTPERVSVPVEVVLPAPEPVEVAPTPSPIVQDDTQSIGSTTTTEPMPTPTPAPSLARTYHGQGWAPGLLWDSGRQEYYSEV